MSSILTEKVTGEWAVPPYMITDPRLWETIPKRDGVSMVTLIEAGVRNVTPGQAKKWGMGRKGGGAIIPYRRFDNRKPLVVPQILPWETTSSRKLEIARLRRSKDVENDGKGKYDQARGTGTQIYVPPQFPAGHVEVLVLVEGEFKALSLMENGIPAIGLSGINGWSRRLADDSRHILPALLEVIRQTTPVKIFYMGDNDVALIADFYREVCLFVERLTVTEGLKIPVFLPRWPLTMKKGVDDVRGQMNADQFLTWWAVVSKEAIQLPAGTTPAQIGKILLESSKGYLTACIDAKERAEIWKRLVKVYSYQREHPAFQTWLKSYAHDCGFDPANFAAHALALRKKQAEDIRKKKEERNGNRKAANGATRMAPTNGFAATSHTGSTGDPIEGIPSVEASFPEIENSMTLVGDATLHLPEELVEGLIHVGTKTVISGESKAGKTWLLMDLAMSVCKGIPFWGLNTRPGRVLYINLEIHRAFTKQRLEILAGKRRVLDHSNLDTWNLRGHAAAMGTLLETILPKLKDKHYAMIIVDPIYKVEGGRDENSAAGMGELCNELERLAVETGAAVVFAHHFSKGQQYAKTAIDRMSGSGVFARDPDTIITLSPHKEEKAYIVETSLRNLPWMPPFVVEWDFPIMTPRRDMDPHKHRVSGGRKPLHRVEDILSLLDATPLKTTAWEKAAENKKGIPKTSFHRLFKQADEDGLIVQNEDDTWIRLDSVEETEEVPEVPE